MRGLGLLYFRRLWMICIAMMIVGTTLVPVASANNTLYYVDCSHPSNGSGTIGSPWNTLSSVNGHAAFQPGDQILLKRGTACSGQLHPLGSGSSGSPITIDAYGSGSAPIVNGGGTAQSTGAVYLLNQQYWVIQNLEVTNISVDLTKDRAGIMVALNGYGGTANYIRILNNYVHDVDSLPDHQVTGGIVVRTFLGVDSWNDVVIQDNTVNNVGRAGITFWDFTWAAAGEPSTNVSVKENVVSNTEGDMIVVYGTDGALIDHNTGSNGGLSSSVVWAVGIWFTRAFNTTMQYNEAYLMQANNVSNDSEGYDVDVSAVNGIVQYNFSHDNAGGGLLVCGGSHIGAGINSDNITIRYNISQNDRGHGALAFSCDSVASNLKVYNNTYYLDSTTTTPVIGKYHSFTNPNESWSFKNNIVYQLGSGGYSLPGTGGVFDYNVFYGNHPGSEPSDSHKLTSDPLLLSPGTGTSRASVEGYKLKAGSPALTSGVLISGNGGLDYWGNAVSSSTAPNRGAYNGSGITVNKDWNFNTAGDFESWNVTYQVSGTVSGGALNITTGGTDPILFSPDNLGITSPATYSKVRVRMKNNTSLTTASVYFITNSATTYDGVKRKDFTIVPNSGYVDYVIDMSTLASWTGTIKQLRLDPVNPATGSGQTLNIDYVRLTN